MSLAVMHFSFSLYLELSSESYTDKMDPNKIKVDRNLQETEKNKREGRKNYQWTRLVHQVRFAISLYLILVLDIKSEIL